MKDRMRSSFFDVEDYFSLNNYYSAQLLLRILSKSVEKQILTLIFKGDFFKFFINIKAI